MAWFIAQSGSHKGYTFKIKAVKIRWGACTGKGERSRLSGKLEQANARRPAPSRGACVCGKALGKSKRARGGECLFRVLFVRKNLICSSDATKLVGRVEFYCNGKELRAAPRQNPRICARAACSMHCAYILYKPYTLGQKSPAGLFAAQCRAGDGMPLCG
jgi:hypothetical protein